MKLNYSMGSGNSKQRHQSKPYKLIKLTKTARSAKHDGSFASEFKVVLLLCLFCFSAYKQNTDLATEVSGSKKAATKTSTHISWNTIDGNPYTYTDSWQITPL